jgi:tRNA-Thr(GGU) m(6)t(6)A37 methyltransferase TsaA
VILSEEIAMEVIGFVRSPVTEGVDEGWGNVVSEIKLDGRYAPGLAGLSEFSHILVVFYMHKSTFDEGVHLQRRPQGLQDMPLIGIFAQRAKHRPNPIGVTAVELLNVKGSTISVRGLDAIDGTPILDIKPYFPAYDCREDALTPSWVNEIMKGYF